jgi:CheY-like chemotaxis protein
MTGPAKPLRCFIVDDNAEFIVAAANLLEREGIVVVGATTSPAEALRCVELLRPDVTLIDVDLGADSGFDLAVRLRQCASAEARSALILISAHAEQDFAEVIAASPAIGFVPKVALSAGAIRELVTRT